MSFRLQPTPPARPNRCQLFGPGSRPAIFGKMAASAADVINLDLEDSVAPSDKNSARVNIIKALQDVDWGSKTISVRINGLDSPYWYRDVIDVLEQSGGRLDQIMIPKVGCAADIYAVDALPQISMRWMLWSLQLKQPLVAANRLILRSLSSLPLAFPMSKRSPPAAPACKP